MAKKRDRFESPGPENALKAADEAKTAIYESVQANTGYEPEFEEAWTAERRLDINTASEADLQDLPGIGPKRAAAIVDHRTETGGFRETAEMTRIPGISVGVYDRFADRVSVGDIPPEEHAVAEGSLFLPGEAVVEDKNLMPEQPEPEEEPAPGQAPTDSGEPLPILEVPPELAEEEVPLAEEVGAPPPPPRPVRAVPPLPRPGIGWPSLLLVGLLSAVAGALLAFLVLWLLNGTLDMQQSAERRLRSEVWRLEGDMEAIRAQVAEIESLAADVEQAQGEIRGLRNSVDTLQTDVTSATRRMDDMQATLAGLSDDMVNVEESVTALGTQLGDIEARLGTMTEELAEAQEAVTRFDAFLDGLRALLSETAATDGAATEVPTLQTMTPMPSPTGSPAPFSTRRPSVTVIPLATRTPTLP
jgi:competence ComEA-like helix-hairpin-helix protein